MLLRARVVVLTEDFHEALIVGRVLSLIYLALEVIVELGRLKTTTITLLLRDGAEYAGWGCSSRPEQRGGETRCFFLQAARK